MKIISLNCFGGRVFEPLMDFLVSASKTTDVFCLQEIQSNPKRDLTTLSPHYGQANLLEEIQDRLPEFSFLFTAMQDDFYFEPAYPRQTQFGNATFYKKSLPMKDEGSFFIYNGFNTYIGNKQWETIGHVAVFTGFNGPIPLTVVNVHGNSQPADKRDTEKRLLQSKKVLDFLTTRPGDHVVMGDFNLFPDTESIRLFERAGYRNLVTDYQISTTRGSNMRTLFPEYAHGPYGWQEFADYAFVSPGIKVTHFSVPDVPISDHLPLILEIDRTMD